MVTAGDATLGAVPAAETGAGLALVRTAQALSIGEDGRAAATPPQSFGMKVLNGYAVWHWAARPFAGPGG